MQQQRQDEQKRIFALSTALTTAVVEGDFEEAERILNRRILNASTNDSVAHHHEDEHEVDDGPAFLSHSASHFVVSDSVTASPSFNPIDLSVAECICAAFGGGNDDKKNNADRGERVKSSPKKMKRRLWGNSEEDEEKEHNGVDQQLSSSKSDTSSVNSEDLLNTLTNEDFCPPLHIACEAGYYSIVKLLLQHGASINKRCLNKDKLYTPLHYAVNGGNVRICELLHDYGAMTMTTSSAAAATTTTAAHYHLNEHRDSGGCSKSTCLIGDGSNNNSSDHNNNKNNNTDHLHHHQHHHDCCTAVTDAKGNTPLHLAVHRADADLIKTILFEMGEGDENILKENESARNNKANEDDDDHDPFHRKDDLLTGGGGGGMLLNHQPPPLSMMTTLSTAMTAAALNTPNIHGDTPLFLALTVGGIPYAIIDAMLSLGAKASFVHDASAIYKGNMWRIVGNVVKGSGSQGIDDLSHQHYRVVEDGAVGGSAAKINANDTHANHSDQVGNGGGAPSPQIIAFAENLDLIRKQATSSPKYQNFFDDDYDMNEEEEEEARLDAELLKAVAQLPLPSPPLLLSFSKEGDEDDDDDDDDDQNTMMTIIKRKRRLIDRLLSRFSSGDSCLHVASVQAGNADAAVGGRGGIESTKKRMATAAEIGQAWRQNKGGQQQQQGATATVKKRQGLLLPPHQSVFTDSDKIFYILLQRATEEFKDNDNNNAHHTHTAAANDKRRGANEEKHALLVQNTKINATPIHAVCNYYSEVIYEEAEMRRKMSKNAPQRPRVLGVRGAGNGDGGGAAAAAVSFKRKFAERCLKRMFGYLLGPALIGELFVTVERGREGDESQKMMNNRNSARNYHVTSNDDDDDDDGGGDSDELIAKRNNTRIFCSVEKNDGVFLSPATLIMNREDQDYLYRCLQRSLPPPPKDIAAWALQEDLFGRSPLAILLSLDDALALSIANATRHAMSQKVIKDNICVSNQF